MNRLLLSLVIILLPLLASSQKKDWQWLKKIDKTNNSFILKTAVHKDGDLLVVGSFADSAVFDNTTLFAKGWVDVFIAKYNVAGDLLWIKQSGGKSKEEAGGLATDADGNIYVLGKYQNPYSPDSIFGYPAKTYNSSSGMYITKLDNNGNAKWTSCAGTNSYNMPDFLFYLNNLAIDSHNNIYVTAGAENDSIDFGNIQLYNPLHTVTAFVVKYDNDGNSVWASVIGDSLGRNVGRAITVDKQDNVYVATFRNETCLAKYAPAGNREWMKIYKSTQWFQPYNICAYDNSLYMIAGLDGIITLNGTPYNFNNTQPMLVNFDNQGEVKWAQAVGPSNSSSSNIGTDRQGNIYVSGRGLLYTRYDKNGAVKWNENADVDFVNFAESQDAFYVSFRYRGLKPATVGGQTIDEGFYIGKLAAFPTNIPTFKNEKAILYPNPVSGTLYIGGAEKGTYTIVDVTGAKHLSGIIGDKRNINISLLAPGIYSFTLTTKNNNLQSTFIKE